MNITIHKFSLRNLNLQLQTLIAKKKNLFKWVKIDIIIYLCVEFNFCRRSQDSNPQIGSQEKIKIKIILIINYCRFVEIESEAYKVCRETDWRG